MKPPKIEQNSSQSVIKTRFKIGFDGKVSCVKIIERIWWIERAAQLYVLKILLEINKINAKIVLEHIYSGKENGEFYYRLLCI